MKQYPQNPKEAQDILTEATHRGQPIIPAGLGHSLPDPLDDQALYLSTKNLTKIISLEPDNLLAQVEAGLTPEVLSQALAPTGLYWPVTGLSNRTLGGIMNEGLPGAESMARGPMTNWILGSGFLTARGDLVASGGRTLKNVSGYDYTRLSWRARGHLAFSTSFILKLLPKPKQAPVLEYQLEDAKKGANLAEQIILDKIAPDSIRLIGQGPSTKLLIWLSGFPEFVDHQIEKIKNIAGEPTKKHDLGFDFWLNHEKFWPIDAQKTDFLGTRRQILNLIKSISPNCGTYDLDISGRATFLATEQNLINEALNKGLNYDIFRPSALYSRIKKAIDPDGLFFPDSILQVKNA